MKRVFAAGSLLFALCGCALLQGHAMGSTRLHGPGQIRLPHAAGAHTIAIAYRAPGEYEEYHRTRHHGAIAEALYMEANGVQTALDFSQFHLHALTARQWRFNRPPARLHWRPARLAPAGKAGRHARVTFARFIRHTPSAGHDRHCVAFIRAWAVPFDDPEQRPGRAYFGYYCRAPGQPLNTDAARRYVTRLGSARHKRQPVRYGDTVAASRKALARARGTIGRSLYGAPNFPLHRVVHYVDSGHNEVN